MNSNTSQPEAGYISPTIAFVLTALLLTVVHLKVDPPMLLLERFILHGGYFEIALLSFYAAFLTRKMADPADSIRLRPKLWAFFSAVFFTQAILGILGIERMLMTGSLHLPVPALIVAGPLYRGGGFFMLILFSVSLLLVGPAWCSHLCYIGAWDDIAARSKKKARPLPKWRNKVRVALMLIVFLVALWLGYKEASPAIAGILAAAFGILGVVIMVIWSRKTGAMVHCTAYCPIGWLATRFGRISPFRIRFGADCEKCGLCIKPCRYDALNMDNIEAGKVGKSCTLCGDCTSACESRQIDYYFLGLKTHKARAVFVTIAVSLHAVFLGVARL